MVVLEHIDALGDARCITVVGDNIGGEVDNYEHVDPSAMQSEMIHERLGGEVSVDYLGMPEIANSCVSSNVGDEGATFVFCGFVQL